MNQSDPSGNTTMAEVLAWLKKSPRTHGWDCLMIFDREQVNGLLMQAYVANLNSSTFLGPVTDTVTIHPNTHWEHIYDYVLDTPRLTFNRGSIRTATITLTMRVMGGTQLTVRSIGAGPKYVSSISAIDPLQGPSLTAQVDLNSAHVTVDANGRSRMKIAAARDFNLTFNDESGGRMIGGSFFEVLFRALPDDRKYLLLNTLTPAPGYGAFLPTKITFRMFQGQNGKHALMCFVGSADTREASLPSDEAGWVYPLPDGYFTLMLFGNHFLTRKAMLDCIHGLTSDTEVIYKSQISPGAEPGEVAIAAGETARLHHTVEYAAPFSTFELDYSFPLIHAYGNVQCLVTCRHADLIYRWSGITPNGYYLKATTTSPTRSCNWKIDWNSEQGFDLRCTADDVTMVRRFAWLHLHANPVAPVDSYYAPHLPTMTESIALHLDEFFRQGPAYAPSPTTRIDILRLHSLLFRTQHLMTLEEASHEMDLALFGKQVARRTLFDVVPPDATMGAASTLQFSIHPTLPPTAQPFWWVFGVPGFVGDRGSIDSNGLYTAPPTDKIPGSYSLVRVQASEGDASSSAMLRIVKRGVAVNPLAMSTWLGANPSRMGAGTLDRGPLDWTLRSRTGATLSAIDIGQHPQYEEGDHFYVPGTSPSGKPFSVDEVIVTNPRTQQSHSACVVVMEQRAEFSITIVDTPALPDNQVQLHFGGNDETPTVSWELLAGSGSLSSTGVYTFDTYSAHRFAVIGASLTLFGMLFANVLILPIPLLELDEVKRVLR